MFFFSAVFFQMSPLALTAIATKIKKEKIVNSIGLQLPFVVENIVFESQPLPVAKEERIMILKPYVQEFKAKRSAMPLTMFYGNLEGCAESFLYFSSELGENQCKPLHADKVAKNRLFTQHYAQYPKHEQERIMEELTNKKC